MGGTRPLISHEGIATTRISQAHFRQDAPSRPRRIRVLALFRNRAELKKAYGELQDEIYRLKDRIKQQEGATQRVQEMLNALETRLGIPETAYPALVFYQLRRLWQSGREIIEQFVADLVRQQEERERRQHLAEHNRRQFSTAPGRRETAARAETSAAEADAQVAELEGRACASHAVLALLQTPRARAAHQPGAVARGRGQRSAQPKRAR